MLPLHHRMGSVGKLLPSLPPLAQATPPIQPTAFRPRSPSTLMILIEFGPIECPPPRRSARSLPVPPCFRRAASDTKPRARTATVRHPAARSASPRRSWADSARAVAFRYQSAHSMPHPPRRSRKRACTGQYPRCSAAVLPPRVTPRLFRSPIHPSAFILQAEVTARTRTRNEGTKIPCVTITPRGIIPPKGRSSLPSFLWRESSWCLTGMFPAPPLTRQQSSISGSRQPSTHPCCGKAQYRTGMPTVETLAAYRYNTAFSPRCRDARGGSRGAKGGMMPFAGSTVVDLFCGAGGLSLGLSRWLAFSPIPRHRPPCRCCPDLRRQPRRSRPAPTKIT